MIFELKSITLRDGRTAALRAPRAEDAHDMNEYLRTVTSETDYLLMCASECTGTDEQEAAYLTQLIESPDSLMIVCEVDGEIAGNCQIRMNSRVKTKHRASIGIGLKQKFWGQGIGTRMFEEMIAAARARGVMQIELEWIEGNDRARRLYEKMGFRTYAEHPNAIRQPSGEMRAEYAMRLVL